MALFCGKRCLRKYRWLKDATTACSLMCLAAYVAFVFWETHRRSVLIHEAWPPSLAELTAAGVPPRFGGAASSVPQKGTVKSKGFVNSSNVTQSGTVAVSKETVNTKKAQTPQTDGKTQQGAKTGNELPSEMASADVLGKLIDNKIQPAAPTENMPNAKRKCKKVRVVSGGKDSGNLAEFELDGQAIASPPSERGINVVIIDPISQKMISKRAYDVWEYAHVANAKLVQDLEDVTQGHVLLVALKDSGAEFVKPSTWLKLSEFGAEATEGRFREGYALIGVKGSLNAVAEKQGPRVEVKGVLDCNSILPKAASPTDTAQSSDGTCKPVMVFSAGKDAGNAAEFFLSGHLLQEPKSKRGLNVVAIEPTKQEVMWKKVYDTFEMIDVANEALFDDLDTLPLGTIVLVGLQDSGMEVLDSYAYDALHGVGATIKEGKFRRGYALVGVKGGTAVAEKSGRSVSVKTRLPCVEAAKLASSAPKPAQGATSLSPLGIDQMLFTVVSDSKFYDTRVRWITDTWGRDVPGRSIQFVADKKTQVEVAGHLVETDCSRGSHDAGCCKFGHAVFAASQRKEDFEWFYFADDDVYVRADAMTKRLGKRRVTKWPVAKGLLGCGNEKCGGICGGGGFLLNRKGLQKVVGNMSKETFVGAMMSNCTYCSHWGDLAISRLMEKSGLKLENMKGLHPWRLQGAKFRDHLFSGEWGIITMHYLRTFSVLNLMHRLFSPSEKDGVSDSGIGAGKDSCITWKDRKVCGQQGDDIIWK